MIGQWLLHYEIVEKLGEGGMGVVYRARDTHLDRFVAIKVLPPGRVADASRKARFVQEAKAASALNHPNIITIYDISSDAGTDFIAMEFVDGRTLDQIIPRKGMRLSEALKLAVQIADALSRAHAAGIVHRDLKPSNVMVDEHGQVKVLDFGLAKLIEPASISADEDTRSITPITEEGGIVGTAAYMSPEQAEGKPVDARSDIFSFGSVLYEMLTGRQPFHGETKLSVLSAILNRELAPLTEAIAGCPNELSSVVMHCLRKDVARRFQHIEDVRTLLEEIREQVGSGKSHAVAKGKHASWMPWAAIAVIVLILASTGVWWLVSRRASERTSAPVLTRLTGDSGFATDPALSRDGKLLAYASDRGGGSLDIWMQQLGGGDPIRLSSGEADEYEPAFSPDGTKIAYRSDEGSGGIFVVSALGGAARKLVDEGRAPQYSPDGEWIAYYIGPSQSGQPSWNRHVRRAYCVRAGGGQPVEIMPRLESTGSPSWSPDGRRLVFIGRETGELPWEQRVDWWISEWTPNGMPLSNAVRTGALANLRAAGLKFSRAAAPWGVVVPRWMPRGEALLFSARSGDTTNIWKIPVSLSSNTVSGEPARLTFGPTIEENPCAVATDGRLRIAFTSLSTGTNLWSLPIDANIGKVLGGPEPITQGPFTHTDPVISRDGSRLAWLSNRGGLPEVWVRHSVKVGDIPVTQSPGAKWNPVLSPEGSRLAFFSEDSIYLVSATGGALKRLCSGCGSPTDWLSGSPGSGGLILIDAARTSIRLIDPTSQTEPTIVIQSTRELYKAVLSPEEDWIAFAAVKDGQSRVFLAPFRLTGGVMEREWISVVPDGRTNENKPHWSPDGNLLYFTSDRDGYRCIWAQRLEPKTKRPTGDSFGVYHSHLARASLSNLQIGALNIAVARDKLIFNIAETTGDLWMLTAASPD